jgi:hypothetical protein|eukprot:COSAG02_NODE_2066_length_9960_cov_3.087009_5_plen_74_part_00
MSEMDKDGDGTVSYAEFESWWRNNGGDLEKHRPLAFTVVLPDLNLLLVRTANATSFAHALMRMPRCAAVILTI